MFAEGEAKVSSIAMALAEAAFQRGTNGLARHLAHWTPPAPIRARQFIQSIAPLLHGDPERAAELYRGRFFLADRLVDAGNRVIFDVPVPSEAFAARLHGFDWLKHLEAAASELPRIQARGLVHDWISKGVRHHPATAHRVTVRARRIISWIRHAPFLLHNADAGFHDTFMASLGRQAAHLMNAVRLSPSGRGRLDGAIALAYAAIALDAMAPLRATLLDRLGRELERQILPDGGHISRAPSVLVDLLLDLVPLRIALKKANCALPQGVLTSIERMLPLLRFFLHGDGGLTNFNGVSSPRTAQIRAIVEADESRGHPVTLAPHTGYARLNHGSSVVIMDIGRPPAAGLNSGAQASSLAFEFSDGIHRIVVNCGTSDRVTQRWKEAARRSAAHSTAIVGERSSCLIIANRISDALFGSPVMLGPHRVEGRLRAHADGSILEARHDGYASAYGCIHERRLYLSKDGLDLRGEDRFIASDAGSTMPETGFSIRFHLHPAVKATTARDGSSIVLVLANRAGWRFSVRGATLGMEDSVYLPEPLSPRRSCQIVLSGVTSSQPCVKWAFKRIERSGVRSGEGTKTIQLPLEQLL
ncbi:MAG: heparinase II/III family protein [Hyphomicrobiales bacterium]